MSINFCFGLQLIVFLIEFSPTLYEKQDFKYASSLVKFIRQSYDTAFTIGVTATPKKYVSFKEENDAFLFLKYKVNYLLQISIFKNVLIHLYIVFR